jgi:putative membrane protein
VTVQLHPNAVLYFILRHAFKLIVLGLFVTVFAMSGTIHGQVNGHPYERHVSGVIPVVLYIALLCVVVGYNWLLVQSYRIELVKEGVALHYGVINLSKEVLLFAKVQDIVITRNLLERMLGLSTITIQNAMGRPEYIPGLGEDTAETLRQNILANVKT